jgi:hypothetical protein
MSVQLKVQEGVYQLSIPAEDILENKLFRVVIDYVLGRQIISESRVTEDQVAESADDVTAN